jgi:hypothetical protein
VPPYDAAGMAQGLSGQLAHFLFPLLVELDRRVDKRLVRTFVQLVAVILTFRDRVNGLLLSELGGYLLSPEHAPAGTKRLSNLLHSTRWSAALIRDSLWQRASEQLSRLPARWTAGPGALGRELLGEAGKPTVGRPGPHTLQ